GRSQSEPSFYIMENKVWNDLYAVFVADPEYSKLLNFYTTNPDRKALVKDPKAWQKGAQVVGGPQAGEFLGVSGAQGRVPVFHLSVTEAHCFAEWLGGLLPTVKQWETATGYHDRSVKERSKGPFDNPEQVAVGTDRPWRVDDSRSEASVYGCRQMAGN